MEVVLVPSSGPPSSSSAPLGFLSGLQHSYCGRDDIRHLPIFSVRYQSAVYHVCIVVADMLHTICVDIAAFKNAGVI